MLLCFLPGPKQYIFHMLMAQYSSVFRDRGSEGGWRKVGRREEEVGRRGGREEERERIRVGYG